MEIGVGFLVRLEQNNGSSTGYKQQRAKLELGLHVESAGLLPVERGWNNTSRYRKRLATTAIILAKNGELCTECRKLQTHCYLINRHVQWIALQSRGKAKLRRMLLRTGQKQWILGCSLRGRQSRNTTHRNSTCSEQVTVIKGPTPVADKNLVA